MIINFNVFIHPLESNMLLTEGLAYILSWSELSCGKQGRNNELLRESIKCFIMMQFEI